jgi:hypothetical protein
MGCWFYYVLSLRLYYLHVLFARRPKGEHLLVFLVIVDLVIPEEGL